MTRRRLAIIAAGIPAALISFVILTILFIPGKAVERVLARALENQGYTLRSSSFGLTFPLGIQGKNLELGSDQGTLLKLDKAQIKLNLLPLFLGRVAFDFRSNIGKGQIKGEFTTGKQGRFAMDVAALQLEEIPFFRTVTDAQVKGELNGKGSFKLKQGTTSGELQLAVKGAELQGVKIGGTPLPDATYKSVQGMLRTGGGKASLESLTFEGDGLYARLKGDMPLLSPISAAPINLTLELMPKAEFLEKQKFVFLLLLKYQTSPGHYQIPVRGTLGKPSLY